MTRSFTNVHPSFLCGGVSPNTLNIRRSNRSPSSWKLEHDAEHYSRPGRVPFISQYEAPSMLVPKSNTSTPGPGFYHQRTKHWEDDLSHGKKVRKGSPSLKARAIRAGVLSPSPKPGTLRRAASR